MRYSCHKWSMKGIPLIKDQGKLNVSCMEIKLDQVCKSWIYSANTAYTKLNVAWYVQCGFVPLKTYSVC